MVSNLYRLYPQFKANPDRRQQEIPVAQDRRSGAERRTEHRPALASDIKKDLYEVKTKFEGVYTTFGEYKTLSKAVANKFLGMSADKNQKRMTGQEIVNIALSPIPMARRLVNIDKNMEDKDNHSKAIGLTAIAAMNVQEDVRDLLTIFGRAKSHAPQGYNVKYGFFVGTSVEKWLQKTVWGKNLLRKDTTIAEDKLGKFIMNKLGVTLADKQKFSKEINHLTGETESVLRRYVKLEGSRFGKIIVLALYRMPKLSLLAAGLLELPNVIKAENKNKFKQIINSTLSVVVGLGCGALFSALLAPLNPVLPIMGLGVGYYVGSKIAKAIGFKLNPND